MSPPQPQADARSAALPRGAVRSPSRAPRAGERALESGQVAKLRRGLEAAKDGVERGEALRFAEQSVIEGGVLSLRRDAGAAGRVQRRGRRHAPAPPIRRDRDAVVARATRSSAAMWRSSDATMFENGRTSPKAASTAR